MINVIFSQISPMHYYFSFFCNAYILEEYYVYHILTISAYILVYWSVGAETCYVIWACAMVLPLVLLVFTKTNTAQKKEWLVPWIPAISVIAHSDFTFHSNLSSFVKTHFEPSNKELINKIYIYTLLYKPFCTAQWYFHFSTP